MLFTLYSDRSYLTSGAPHVPILLPFWGRTPEDPNEPARGRYERYVRSGGQFFQMGSLEDCDAAIFPQSWGSVIGDEAAEARAAAFVACVNEAAKPAVVFFYNDSAEPVGLDATVFRTSLYRSCRSAHEFAQPAWSEDFVERYLGGMLPLRGLKRRPVTGFCGYAPRPPATATTRGRLRRVLGNGKRRVQASLGHLPPVDFVRARALDALQRHPDVDTNVVLRDEFWGGITSRPDPAALLRLRGEYVQNIVDSDYVLCARGGGNFSYRLYETLSCGRIPVFVDTDCVLPLEFVIDWKDYCVWVDQADLADIGDRVAAFHASLTRVEFADRQRACRRLWETHLSPHGFFAHFHEHFT